MVTRSMMKRGRKEKEKPTAKSWPNTCEKKVGRYLSGKVNRDFAPKYGRKERKSVQSPSVV
jgi:hypothetical protein